MNSSGVGRPVLSEKVFMYVLTVPLIATVTVFEVIVFPVIRICVFRLHDFEFVELLVDVCRCVNVIFVIFPIGSVVLPETLNELLLIDL